MCAGTTVSELKRIKKLEAETLKAPIRPPTGLARARGSR
jgi:hypothetical protein